MNPVAQALNVYKEINRRQLQQIAEMEKRIKQLESDLEALQAECNTNEAKITAIRANMPAKTVALVIPPDWNLAGAPKQGLYRL